MSQPIDATVSVADRLKAAAGRAGDPAAKRKMYRMRVISTKEKPAPFVSATVAGHAFSERTERNSTDERGHSVRETRIGTYEQLTDSEVATIRSKMKDYIVRWENREGLIARVIDASIPTVVVDPSTDELLESYLSLEPVSG